MRTIPLLGEIKRDRGYFRGVSTKPRTDPLRGRPDRSAVGKVNDVVMEESTSSEDMSIGAPSKHVRDFKAKVLEVRQSDDMNLMSDINIAMAESIDDNSIVLTDKMSYAAMADDFGLRMTENASKDITEGGPIKMDLLISNVTTQSDRQ